jgi:hypothetical protein
VALVFNDFAHSVIGDLLYVEHKVTDPATGEQVYEWTTFDGTSWSGWLREPPRWSSLN